MYLYFFDLAERMGFEPMRDLHLLAVFETAPFNRLGTSPAVVIISSIVLKNRKKCTIT